MNFNKIREACRPIRVILGFGLISYGIFSLNPYFFLGAVPLIAGAINFCPLCTITNKCEI